MYALEVKNLSFSYNEDKVLEDINFKVEDGEFISVIGPNGSGKSTLLKLINNLYKPKSGNVLIYDKDVSGYKAKDLAKRIAMVPQDTNIEYEFPVEDIVLMGRHPYISRFQKEDDEDYAIVNEALKLTNTSYLKGRNINRISGGERQRVLIAKAIAQNPDLILLDEPTSHLDINYQMEIFKLLKKLNENKKTTIILVVHDINLASRYSDRVILLKGGKVLGIGKPSEVINNDNIEKAYNLKVAVEKNLITNSIYVTPL